MSSRERGRASNIPACSIISSHPVACPSVRVSKMLYSSGPRRIGLACGSFAMRAEVEPVVAVRAHDFRIAVVDLGEELARPGEKLPTRACSAGPIHGFTVRMS